MTSSAHSTRTSNLTPSSFFSHGDDHCDDPQHVATFVPLAEPQLRTGYEPNDLTEMNNTEVNPMFFHRPSMASTHDSTESIATPHEADLDDEQFLAGFTNVLTGERQVPTDHECITLTEKTQCQVHLTFEQVQRDVQQCSHTEGSRVKNHIPTDNTPRCAKAQWLIPSTLLTLERKCWSVYR